MVSAVMVALSSAHRNWRLISLNAGWFSPAVVRCCAEHWTVCLIETGIPSRGCSKSASPACVSAWRRQGAGDNRHAARRPV